MGRGGRGAGQWEHVRPDAWTSTRQITMMTGDGAIENHPTIYSWTLSTFRPYIVNEHLMHTSVPYRRGACIA